MRLRFPSPPSPDRVEQLLTRAAPDRPVGATAMSDAPVAPDVPDVLDASVAPDEPGSKRPRSGRGPRHRDLTRTSTPAVLTLPGPLRGASVRPAWLAVAGLALVGLVALGLLAGRAAVARVAAAPTPVAAPTSPQASGGSALDASERPKESPGGGPPSGAASVSSAAASSGGPVVVHVVGHVRTPGVVTVTAGARMRDAVTAAGGPLASAELGVVNLARVVTDGEQIAVPARGSPEASAAAAAAAAAATGSGPSARGAAGATGAGGSGGPVNLNSADAAALDTLPGVGPVTAQKILDWREKHGRFTRIEELGEVPGIGPKLLAQLTSHVTV